MRKRPSAVGNRLGIVSEKPVLELLGIDRETELDVRTDGERLIISPIRNAKEQRVRAALERARGAHAASLRTLARRRP